MTDVPVRWHSRRRWWWLAAGVVFILAPAGAVVATTLSDQPPTEPVAARCTLPVVPPAPASSAAQASLSPGAAGGPTQAPSGGAIVVAEQGFSVADKWTRLSFGAVLENTSREVAYRTRVKVRPYNRAGVMLLGAESNHYLFEIPVILPGERVNLGSEIAVDEYGLVLEPQGRGLPGADIQTSRLDIAVLGAQWIPQTEGATGFKPVSAALVSASLAPGGSFEIGSTRFVVESGYCAALVFRGWMLVLRDSAGAIVGGSHGGKLEKQDLCRSGRGEHSVAVTDRYWPIKHVDLTKTTMSVYCDVAVAPPLRPKPGGPMN